MGDFLQWLNHDHEDHPLAQKLVANGALLEKFIPTRSPLMGRRRRRYALPNEETIEEGLDLLSRLQNAAERYDPNPGKLRGCSRDLVVRVLVDAIEDMESDLGVQLKRFDERMV